MTCDVDVKAFLPKLVLGHSIDLSKRKQHKDKLLEVRLLSLSVESIFLTTNIADFPSWAVLTKLTSDLLMHSGSLMHIHIHTHKEKNEAGELA